VFGNPALLCGVRPGEKQAEGDHGENPGPNEQPQTIESRPAKIKSARVHVFPFLVIGPNDQAMFVVRTVWDFQ
jgi:hypothetical protein